MVGVSCTQSDRTHLGVWANGVGLGNGVVGDVAVEDDHSDGQTSQEELVGLYW